MITCSDGMYRDNIINMKIVIPQGIYVFFDFEKRGIDKIQESVIKCNIPKYIGADGTTKIVMNVIINAQIPILKIFSTILNNEFV